MDHIVAIERDGIGNEVVFDAGERLHDVSTFTTHIYVDDMPTSCKALSNFCGIVIGNVRVCLVVVAPALLDFRRKLADAEDIGAVLKCTRVLVCVHSERQEHLSSRRLEAGRETICLVLVPLGRNVHIWVLHERHLVRLERISAAVRSRDHLRVLRHRPTRGSLGPGGEIGRRDVVPDA